MIPTVTYEKCSREAAMRLYMPTQAERRNSVELLHSRKDSGR